MFYLIGFQHAREGKEFDRLPHPKDAVLRSRLVEGYKAWVNRRLIDSRWDCWGKP